MPPLAVKVVLYAVPAVPEGRGPVVMIVSAVATTREGVTEAVVPLVSVTLIVTL